MTELLSKRDTAGVLGVSEQTVERLARDGKISPVRIGRRVLFRPEDVRHLIDTLAGERSLVAGKPKSGKSTHLEAIHDVLGQGAKEDRS